MNIMPRYHIMLTISLLMLTKLSFAQNKTYDSLITELQIIDSDDQSTRMQIDSIRDRYTLDTSGMTAAFIPIWSTMRKKDSVNLLKVMNIIDRYGWLGPTAIGDDGNATLFIVIQHADLKIQQKYLPLIRDAVKKGSASTKNLAFLEDRVALREGKNQIYGTQLFENLKTNKHYVLPLEDPYHVDERRARMGLEPMSSYLGDNHWGGWNIKVYLNDLPYVDSVFKKNPM